MGRRTLLSYVSREAAVGRRTDWKDIQEVLSLGIALELPERRGTRRFIDGQITKDKRGKMTRTTHRGPSGRDLWLNREAIAYLGHQARRKLLDKENILQRQREDSARFYDR